MEEEERASEREREKFENEQSLKQKVILRYLAIPVTIIRDLFLIM